MVDYFKYNLGAKIIYFISQNNHMLTFKSINSYFVGILL